MAFAAQEGNAFSADHVCYAGAHFLALADEDMSQYFYSGGDTLVRLLLLHSHIFTTGQTLLLYYVCRLLQI